jgi:hypothetical protein
MSKSAFILPTVVLLALCVGSCGRAGTDAGKTSSASTSASGSDGLMVDQDGDSRPGGYYDSDDGEIRNYGKPASTAEARAIETLIQRYYAAAATGDATKACGLTYYLEAETLPEQYGEPPGPRWLQGASTCREVLARVFAHFHSELTVAPIVTAVRVSGTHADVLVGFKTLPAGYVTVRREGTHWKVDGLLAAPLP